MGLRYIKIIQHFIFQIQPTMFNAAFAADTEPPPLVHEPPILVQKCCNGNTVLAGWLFQSKLEIIIEVQ